MLALSRPLRITLRPMRRRKGGGPRAETEPTVSLTLEGRLGKKTEGIGVVRECPDVHCRVVISCHFARPAPLLDNPSVALHFGLQWKPQGEGMTQYIRWCTIWKMSGKINCVALQDYEHSQFLYISPCSDKKHFAQLRCVISMFMDFFLFFVSSLGETSLH